jgi:hypothetical protein
MPGSSIIQKSSSSLNVSDTPLHVLATESMLAEITIGLIIPAGGTSPVAPSVVKNTSVLGAEDSGFSVKHKVVHLNSLNVEKFIWQQEL